MHLWVKSEDFNNEQWQISQSFMNVNTRFLKSWQWAPTYLSKIIVSEATGDKTCPPHLMLNISLLRFVNGANSK